MKRLGLILLYVAILSFVAGCGSSSSSSGGGGDDTDTSCGDYAHDADCEGPAVGQSPNDSDNTFRSLAVHPSDPNTVIIGGEGNGIFKSIDGGESWSIVNEGLCYEDLSGYCAYPEIYEIIFDFSDPTKLYAATTSGPGSGGVTFAATAGDISTLIGH